MRKQLHSYIQVLKGSMRVFCRVKPLNNQVSLELRKSSAYNKNCIEYPQALKDEYPNQVEVVPQDSQSKLYHFDAVFPPDTNQESIFKEVKQFIQTAIDGENVCIFAYGQTGAGKTFTMEGPNSQLLFDDNFQVHELSGILPRAADFIFKEIRRLKKAFNREYHIEVSSLEIYCENVKDLFSQSDQHLNLITNKGKLVVQNQVWKRVSSTKEFLELIKESSSKRVFACNGMNEHSSRSHHVFQIKIIGQNKAFASVESLLNIVDLAGSERRQDHQVPSNLQNPQQDSSAKTGTIKGRFAKPAQLQKQNTRVNKANEIARDPRAEQTEGEAVFINKSLTTLGRVFMMLADRKAKNKHNPPYRESKLTRILQDSLTYESKTLMIVNVCSGLENVSQTKESLNFASQAMLAY